MLIAFLWSLVDPAYPWSYQHLWPQSLSFHHWIRIFTGTNIVTAIGNSFMIAGITIITTAVLSLPTAYALGRRKIKGKETFKILMLFPMMFPGMAMALFMGRLIFTWGFSSTYTGVIMAHTLIAIPFMLRILTVSFEVMPQELIDAAQNLGANRWTTLWEIYVPMILPGITAGAIFAFVTSMEEFVMTFIIGAPRIITIPTILFSYLGFNFMRTGASVVSLILVIPNVVLLLVTERFIKTEYMGAALGKM